MKIYQSFKHIIEKLQTIEIAWFTTFNLDPVLVEKFLVSALVGKSPAELKTAEDYEALNEELKDIDIKVWYDYRALNLDSPKRTTIDFIPVNTESQFNRIKDTLFHPKVIFLKNRDDAFLICGSANLSIAAWSSNCESVVIKKINSRDNALAIIGFFEKLGGKTNKELNQWANQKSGTDDWIFVNSLTKTPKLVEYLAKNAKKLFVWAPYFSKGMDVLTKNILSAGFDNINIVPDITESGKVRIKGEILESCTRIDSLKIHKTISAVQSTNIHRLFHAKVWLTEDKLAVGSWNYSFRATGINTIEKETNIEAGIIISSNAHNFKKLTENLVLYDYADIYGTTDEELASEWAGILSPFTFSCVITANWKQFTYHIDTIPENEDYTVLLPHQSISEKRIKLTDVNQISFRNSYSKVLKNKSFTVYDSNDQEIFQGYIIEQGKHERPVYGYSNLTDLMESLLRNPLSETERKKVKYSFEEEDTHEAYTRWKKHLWDFQDDHSYYLMFLSFQKLYDKIEESKGNYSDLDKIGFRLPGSLLNIKLLVESSLPGETETTNVEDKEDCLLYYWYLVNEVNRCISLFNSYFENKIVAIENSTLQELQPSKNDLKFIRMIEREFNYE
jgi:phosphatidylserine/phosphatidylglycerophosphate/cardiolipin synthase-like enzyme